MKVRAFLFSAHPDVHFLIFVNFTRLNGFTLFLVMNSAVNPKIFKENYDIVKLQKQWLWYICAVLLLLLMLIAAFVCFYQTFALVNKNPQFNQKEKK